MSIKFYTPSTTGESVVYRFNQISPDGNRILVEAVDKLDLQTQQQTPFSLTPCWIDANELLEAVIFVEPDNSDFSIELDEENPETFTSWDIPEEDELIGVYGHSVELAPGQWVDDSLEHYLGES